MTKKPDNKSGELEHYKSLETRERELIQAQAGVNDRLLKRLEAAVTRIEKLEADVDSLWSVHMPSWVERPSEIKEPKKKMSEYKWIPVSERLPEEDGLYEVTIKSVFKDTQPYTYRSIYKTYYPQRDKDVVGWQHPGVIAWKEHPEPDPPKPEEDNR